MSHLTKEYVTFLFLNKESLLESFSPTEWRSLYDSLVSTEGRGSQSTYGYMYILVPLLVAGYCKAAVRLNVSTPIEGYDADESYDRWLKALKNYHQEQEDLKNNPPVIVDEDLTPSFEIAEPLDATMQFVDSSTVEITTSCPCCNKDVLVYLSLLPSTHND